MQPLRIVDLHNTLYDEVIEYGESVVAALSVWKEVLPAVQDETLHHEMAIAHATLANDWHPDVWDMMPSLRALPDFSTYKARANAVRESVSRDRTTTLAYTHVIDTLQTWHAGGVRIIVVTEGTAAVAARAIDWLGLDGVIDVLYAMPDTTEKIMLTNTEQRCIPTGLQKPHAAVLAHIVVDTAKQQGTVPADIDFDALYEAVVQPDSYAPNDVDTASHHAACIRMQYRRSAYADVLDGIRKQTVCLGDSIFRDGIMAHNFGVPFAYAAYGKRSVDATRRARAEAIMYAVTGWNAETLRHTQSNTAHNTRLGEVPIAYVCTNDCTPLLS